MKNRAFALVVAGACGLTLHANAHELAYSKAEQIRVLVDGDASTWCKPQIAITLTRPTWDDPKPLNTLLGKLPFIFNQECPSAKVTWQAVNAEGAVYATGSGNAANLGIATLSVAPAVQPEAVPAAAPVVVAAPAAPAPAATAPQAPAPAPQATPAAPEPAPVQAPAPQADAPEPVAEVPPVAAPVAVAAAPSADFGRALVVANSNLVSIADGSGCKWLISKSAIDDNDPSLALAATPAMPCGTSGYAEGAFDKVRWSVPNTYRGDTWTRAYVHPSGLMFSQANAAAVKDKALSYLSSKADQALFEVGELPARNMKVYLAYRRSTYRVLPPFSGNPYYVAITADEKFALDPVEYKQTVLDIHQLLKATSPATVELAELEIAKNLPALYPEGYASDDSGRIVRNRMGENRGNFYFDAREGTNFTQRREETRLRNLRREQQQLANLHERVLARYDQLQAGMADYKGRETEALAQMAGIKVTFDAPMNLLNPGTSKSVTPMMVHVTGKKGEFHQIDFPRNGRLQADVELNDGWYVLPVANMTPYLPLEDGRAVPTFRAYSAGDPQACKQVQCADRVSFGAVLAKEFPAAGIDFDWTPDVSRQHVAAWQNASAPIQ